MLLVLAVVVYDILAILLVTIGHRLITRIGRTEAFIASTFAVITSAILVFTASLFDAPTMTIALSTVPLAGAVAYAAISSSLGVPPSPYRLLGFAVVSEMLVLMLFALSPLISYAGRAITFETVGPPVRFELPGFYSLIVMSFSITGAIITLMMRFIKKEWRKQWALVLPSLVLTITYVLNPEVWMNAYAYAEENPLVAAVIWAICAYIIAMAYIQLSG